MNKKIGLMLLGLSFVSLQGCAVAFVAGAAAGGLAVHERQPIKLAAEDHKLFVRVNDHIYYDKELYNPSHITVIVFNRIVLLTGQTPTAEFRQRAQQYADSAPGVSQVYNEITVSGNTSPLTRSSDSWITTKARTLMLSTKGLSSSQIKVATENGTVYLMGIVTRQQAEMAVNTVRNISGVQKVVKIFQFTD